MPAGTSVALALRLGALPVSVAALPSFSAAFPVVREPFVPSVPVALMTLTRAVLGSSVETSSLDGSSAIPPPADAITIVAALTLSVAVMAAMAGVDAAHPAARSASGPNRQFERGAGVEPTKYCSQ